VGPMATVRLEGMGDAEIEKVPKISKKCNLFAQKFFFHEAK
jgi:hypothetical protein